jgi:hypothetical protein
LSNLKLSTGELGTETARPTGGNRSKGASFPLSRAIVSPYDLK